MFGECIVFSYLRIKVQIEMVGMEVQVPGKGFIEVVHHHVEVIDEVDLVVGLVVEVVVIVVIVVVVVFG